MEAQPLTLWIKSYKQPAVMYGGLVLASLFFVFLHWSGNKKSTVSAELSLQVSDMIPAGFVMVPIELANHSAVNDLISSFGIVDLYQKLTSQQELYKLAQAVRIVRLETGRFSVLIPEKDAGQFVQHQSLFYAVVQNSEKKGSQITPPRFKRRRSIIVEEPELQEE